MPEDRKKGQFTFRTAAVLSVLSALFELLSAGSETLLFGAIRGGIVAGIYHLVYVALFMALGVGLWRGKSWGYPLVFATTAVYTLDKLQFVLSRDALETLVTNQLAGYENELLIQGLDTALIMQAIVLMSIVVVLCWWGFALYTYLRRDYFRNGAV